MEEAVESPVIEETLNHKEDAVEGQMTEEDAVDCGMADHSQMDHY